MRCRSICDNINSTLLDDTRIRFFFFTFFALFCHFLLFANWYCFRTDIEMPGLWHSMLSLASYLGANVNPCFFFSNPAPAYALGKQWRMVQVLQPQVYTGDLEETAGFRSAQPQPLQPFMEGTNRWDILSPSLFLYSLSHSHHNSAFQIETFFK